MSIDDKINQIKFSPDNGSGGGGNSKEDNRYEKPILASRVRRVMIELMDNKDELKLLLDSAIETIKDEKKGGVSLSAKIFSTNIALVQKILEEKMETRLDKESIKQAMNIRIPGQVIDMNISDKIKEIIAEDLENTKPDLSSKNPETPEEIKNDIDDSVETFSKKSRDPNWKEIGKKTREKLDGARSGKWNSGQNN